MADPVDNALPPGYRIHEFEIVRVAGVGGFGIVYLARDLQLQRTVALKEYMPSALATRSADQAICARSPRYQPSFELGLRSFVNEARLLASIDHPSLVKVYRFWEQNGTAFMVMPFYEGPTLKAFLKQSPHTVNERWLKDLLAPLLDALEAMHAQYCYHRDIALDNILLIGERKRPLLIDFGAARRESGEAAQAFTVILKHGYAPIEQYAEIPGMKQGPWTDVYALCAVLYTAISGQEPVSSVARMSKDEMVPLLQRTEGAYSVPFLMAIDRGLSLRPEDRPQNIAALRASLFALDAQDPERTVIRAPITATPTLAQAGAQEVIDGPTPTSQTRARASSRWGAARVLALMAAIAVATAAAWWTARRWPATSSAEIHHKVLDPSAASSALTVRPRGVFSSLAVLEDIVGHANARISVNTVANDQTLVIGHDRMQFRVESSEAGYLYMFLSGTDGRAWLLFPNRRDSNNVIAANTQVVLPRKGWEITAGGPAGLDHIVTLVSRAPRDFSHIGLRPDGDIREFDLNALQREWANPPGPRSAYAGTPACSGRANCDATYGATMTEVTEVSPSR